jgi:hypothetical protein
MLFPQTTREFITTCDIFKPIQACPAYDIVLKKKKKKKWGRIPYIFSILILLIGMTKF